MATANGEGSSSIPKSPGEKPVVVRVKRKASQSPLDAFWLEINERPLKRPFLDFERLSIAESSGNEELRTKRVLVQHVQTVLNPEATIDIVQLVVSNSADASEHKTRAVERRNTFKKDNRPNLLSKSRQKQEELAKNARFEQIWRSRKGKKEEVDEMCHFYEVVRVDGAEERSNDVKDQQDMSLEDHRILTSYLPLLREFIPSAAEEIESDMQTQMSSQEEYVYDLYTVNTDMDVEREDSSNPFPLVQVDDEDFYDVAYESEYDSEDSNAEDNPRNDYPDEISEEEDELENESSNGSEEKSESASDGSSEPEDLRFHGSLEDGGILCEDETYDDYHDEADDFDNGNSDDNIDGEDWR
ncbi:hypothetical protein SLE2022_076790 [Rubroshorea leprosula]